MYLSHILSDADYLRMIERDRQTADFKRQEREQKLLDEYDRKGASSDLYAFIMEQFMDVALASARMKDGGIEIAQIGEIPEIAAKELALRELRAEGVL